MFTVLFYQIALIVLAFGVAGYIWYQKDDQQENRRRNYLAVADLLKAHGFVQIPSFLDNLAIGDYDGALWQVRKLSDLMQHPAQVEVEFGKVLERLVLKAAETEKGKADLVALLARVTPGTAAKVADKVVADAESAAKAAAAVAK